MAQTDSVTSEKVYSAVQVIPSFPGGMQAFYHFLSNTVRYPADAREHNTQGKVIVQFVVEKDGTLTALKLWKPVKDGLGEEALRVMKLSPKWNPGTQNGKAVRVAYSVPISFALAN